MSLKRMGLKSVLLSICIVLALVWMTSCVSNNEEELYPDEPCDTTQVTYSGTIAPIINQNCLSCHGAIAPSSGIPLEGYDNLKQMVDEGRLVGAVRREDGFSAMPQDAPQLPDCKLDQIEVWVNEGAPNN